MSKFVTNVAVSIKGDRVVKGTTVELDPKEAARYGDDLSPVDGVKVEEPEPTPEKALDEMDKDELKAKAKSLGLKVSGSVADLVERITLHLEGEEVEAGEEVED